MFLTQISLPMENLRSLRRLLYVACTRAKGLLYLTRCLKRTIAGNLMDRKTSQFVSHVEQIDEVRVFDPSVNLIYSFRADYHHERESMCFY